MDKAKWQRYGWLIYSLIAAVAIIFILLGALKYTQDPTQSVLLGLGINLLSVSIIFFFVQQLFLWNPEDEQQKQLDSHINRLGELLEQAPSVMSDIQFYPTRAAVYEAGCLALEKYEWYRLRIFAPVGLWEKNKRKEEWLKSVAENSQKKKVQSVWGVFGLPPKERRGGIIPCTEVVDNLVQARKALEPLNELSNVELHFYPPFSASVGFGALIFQYKNQLDGELAFALSNQGDEETIDSGFGIVNKQLFLVTKQWFDDQIFLKSTSKFILQDKDNPIDQQWETVVKNWYGENHLEDFRKAWEEEKKAS